MAIVTTTITVLGLIPSYGAGTTLDGLQVRYRIDVFHDGTVQPNGIIKMVDIWSNLSGGQKSTAQGIFDAAKAKLDT